MWGAAPRRRLALLVCIAALGSVVQLPGSGPADAAAAQTAAPSISSVSPMSGAVGSTVSITGSNFTGVNLVSFHDYPTSYTVVSETQITATVPAGTPSPGRWRVRTSQGLAVYDPLFTVTSPEPSISGVSPMSGAVGSTVSITGSNFTGVNLVSFHDYPTSYTVVSATQITATVPGGTPSPGRWRVRTTAGLAVYDPKFTVTVDTTPPTQPAAPTVTGATASSISASWGASSDNVGVTGYGRYRNGTLVSSGAGTSHTFTGLNCGTMYTLGVDAYDAAGNRSAQVTVNAATTACPPGHVIRVYTEADPPRTPTIDELPRLTSVTKDGITWTFAQPTPVGQFITGDYYVVGPVTVTAISPAPANGRNGSVKNIPPVDGASGFDSRTGGNRYDASLRANPPVSLAPDDSLVSSISVETVGQLRRILFDTATSSPVRTVSILTSVSAPQPPDAFRPSYVGRGSPTYFSRNLRRDLLPRLAPVSGTPTLAQFEGYFRRPWIDNVFFNFDAPIEYMPDYGREIARAVGMAGLLLMLDYAPEQKEPLLVYLTQYGIDLGGLVRLGHRGWPAHGGHGSGRKFPIVFAGTLLGVPELQRPSGVYGEDLHTMYGQGWTGATALYAGHYGRAGTGQYGPYEHLQPRDWLSLIGEDYRRCCTSNAWIGEALAGELVPAVKSAWSYPAFFDYAQRWMTEDDTQALAAIRTQTGKDYSAFPQREAWDGFVTNMWEAHR